MDAKGLFPMPVIMFLKCEVWNIINVWMNVERTKELIVSFLKALEIFIFMCFLVRYRVKTVLNMLEDDEVLRNERRKAKVAGKDEKYKGFSRDEMNMRGN